MTEPESRNVSEQWDWAAEDLRVPFVFHLERQEYVDVSEVGRGAAAGCICPSCRVPLLSRQGNAKRWHFAHETRGTYRLAADQCRFSIWTAMVLMGRQELGRCSTFLTPDYVLRQQSMTPRGVVCLEETVTRGRNLAVDGSRIEAQQAGAKWDALLEIQKFKLAIALVHREKRLSMLEVESRSDHALGILSVDLPTLWTGALALLREGKFSHREAFRRVLLESEVGKTWEYHPLQEDKQTQLQERIAALQKPSSTPSYLTPSPNWQASTTSWEPPARRRKVKCMRCQHRWANPASSGSACPACGEKAAWIPDE
jgi:hypothetical protein